MSDPFAHGTPAGDHHTWVKPSSPDCPDCTCCTVYLCSRADEQSVPCSSLVAGTPETGVMDVSNCPCAAGAR